MGGTEHLGRLAISIPGCGTRIVSGCFPRAVAASAVGGLEKRNAGRIVPAGRSRMVRSLAGIDGRRVFARTSRKPVAAADRLLRSKERASIARHANRISKPRVLRV